ncbi:MAG: hypothetical protein R6U98_12445 [Pirellulaceae bacterium]
MESCPAQAVLPLVGLAAAQVIRDRHIYFNVAKSICRTGLQARLFK